MLMRESLPSILYEDMRVRSSGAELGDVRVDRHGVVVPRNPHRALRLPGVGVVLEDRV